MNGQHLESLLKDPLDVLRQTNLIADAVTNVLVSRTNDFSFHLSEGGVLEICLPKVSQCSDLDLGIYLQSADMGALRVEACRHSCC